ncbi:hypothetical protein L596_001400 [Steinernema carpocapsae]|uniref:Uncharacterized protein n=1 Tax=Steinernema carpocapsae TaxID=34508 RepID=A0A4U8UQ62_STECR|nr:hypothetical protein L596_001400 [Steinernema carpocapsae]
MFAVIFDHWKKGAYKTFTINGGLDKCGMDELEDIQPADHEPENEEFDSENYIAWAHEDAEDGVKSLRVLVQDDRMNIWVH